MRNKFFNALKNATPLAMIGWALIILAFVTLCSEAEASPFSPDHARNGVIRVDRCDGGLISEHVFDLAMSQAQGAEIRVAGTMYSACTLALAFDNVTVNAAHTTWCFHAASVDGVIDRRETLAMWEMYPQAVRDLLPSPLVIGLEYHCLRGEVVAEAMAQ